jgi:hypothetical protein
MVVSRPARRYLDAIRVGGNGVRYGVVLLCVALSACAKTKQSGSTAADSLTQRQRDSALGASKVPGARGVQGALKAQDSVAARNARIDSIQ